MTNKEEMAGKSPKSKKLFLSKAKKGSLGNKNSTKGEVSKFQKTLNPSKPFAQEAAKKAGKVNGSTPDQASKTTPQKIRKNNAGVKRPHDDGKAGPDGKKAKVGSSPANASQIISKKQPAKVLGIKRVHDGKAVPESQSKKPKLEEMKKKERKVVRKSQRNNFELSQKAKHIWEKLRREDCPKPAQLSLSQELYDLIKGNVMQLAFAHDTARVIESLILLGNEQIRKSIYETLKDDIVTVMKSKYAKHIIIKLLKHSTKEQRNTIIKSMYGKVIKLIRHSEAAHVVEFAYNEFANAQQRACLMEEFYGPTFALFKDNEIKTLAGVLAKQPFQKDGILAYMKETLNAIVDKSVIMHSVIHHALLEYLMNCSPQNRSEMIEAIREHVVEILHTKNGAKIGLQCIFHGTAKDRKVIIKSMKNHVFKICHEESGLLVLLAIFDCVDDTKLVQQLIIDELMRKADQLAFSKQGRKVLFYLVAPRNHAYFSPQFLSALEQGDGSTTSKKECSVRRMEFLKYVSAKLLQLVADNAETMIICPAASVVAQAILIHCIGDPTSAFTKIVEYLEKADSDKIENTLVHVLLKRLLHNDKLKAKEDGNVLFSRVLLDLITPAVLTSWINCNRGCFTLLLILETEVPSVIKNVKRLLASSLEEISALKKTSKGAELLYKALTKK